MTREMAPEGIIVLGMHRSGTSATAGALAALGLHLGDRLVPAATDNPHGYFENADAVSVSENLLAALDRSWDDVRELPRDWVDSIAASDTATAIRARILPALREQRPWALKDPRMCRLLPLWRRLLAEQNVQTACVLVLRHPHEVAASLHARDRMPAVQAQLLWLRHVFESIAGSVGLQRVVLPYASLLADPVAALLHVSDVLGIEYRHKPEAGVLDAFIDPQARHHAGLEAGPSASVWSALAATVYEALLDRVDPWAHIERLSRDFEILCRKHADEIEVLGGAINAANRRRRALERGLLQQLRFTERALSNTEQLSVQRMEESQAFAGNLEATEAALAAAEALAFNRQAESEALAGNLEATAAALASAEQMAVNRLAELQAMQEQLTATVVAFDQAQRLALQRQQELHVIDDERNELARRLDLIESSPVWRSWSWIANKLLRVRNGPP